MWQLCGCWQAAPGRKWKGFFSEDGWEPRGQFTTLSCRSPMGIGPGCGREQMAQWGPAGPGATVADIVHWQECVPEGPGKDWSPQAGLRIILRLPAVLHSLLVW